MLEAITYGTRLSIDISKRVVKSDTGIFVIFVIWVFSILLYQPSLKRLSLMGLAGFYKTASLSKTASFLIIIILACYLREILLKYTLIMPYPWSNTRLYPCQLLHECNIPCVVWFEDALARYQVPTFVFDLYILVPDINEAAEVLAEKGYTLLEQYQARIGNANVQSAQHRLLPPKDISNEAELDPRRQNTIRPLPSYQEPSRPTAIVLLPASQWNFALPARHHWDLINRSVSFFPELPALVDALIDSFLNTPLEESMLVNHLRGQITYLYTHNPALKESSFARLLKYEHRQYHLDRLSGTSTGTLYFIRRQRVIRDTLRESHHKIRECSATNDIQGPSSEKV